MTLQTLALLRVLLDESSAPYYGLKLSKAVHLPTGTIYPILARLERAGWLSSEWEQLDPAVIKAPRRRFYRLTPAGTVRARQALERNQQWIWAPRHSAPGQGRA